MWYAYRIPTIKPKNYLITDELFTTNVSKLRCEYAEEDKNILLHLVRDYPTLDKKKNDPDYKKYKTLICWTPAKLKSGRIICPETRKEYLYE